MDGKTKSYERAILCHVLDMVQKLLDNSWVDDSVKIEDLNALRQAFSEWIEK